MILIGLTGKARSGKDTVGQMLVGYGLDRVAFADPIKRMLIEGLGLGPEHVDSPLKEQPIPWLGKSPRQLMQTLGTEWGRAQHPEIWTLIAGREITASRLAGRGVVITDVRFENEAAFVRRQGGEIWHIWRDVEPVAAHSSEAGVAPLMGDRYIGNSGTLQELRNSVAITWENAVFDAQPLERVGERRP